MAKTEKQYRLILGTFIDNQFIWHDVDSYDTLEEAYKEYKKYVNEQLKYTDEELSKVWNTGRLDVELLRGSKLLNWTGIYAREVDKNADDEEDDEPVKEPVKPKDSIEREWIDEDGNRVTEDELRTEFEFLKERMPDEYDYGFEEYVEHCGVCGALTPAEATRKLPDSNSTGLKKAVFRLVTEGRADGGYIFERFTTSKAAAERYAAAETERLPDTEVRFIELKPIRPEDRISEFDIV